jgi:hypothetical protein
MSSDHPIENEALVGAPGTRLRKLKTPAEKRQISEMLKRGSVEPAVALRAYLAINKAPTADLLSTSNILASLSAVDRASQLQRLSRKSQIVDAEGALEALRSTLAQSAKYDPWRTGGILDRALTKWSKSKINERSLFLVIALTTSLVCATRGTRPPKANKNYPFRHLIRSIMSLAAGEKSAELHFESLKLLLLAVDYMGAEIEHMLDQDAEDSKAFQRLLSEALADLDELAATSNVAALERYSRILLRHRVTEPQTKRELFAKWEQRSKYATSVQRALSEILDLETLPAPLEIEDESSQSLKALQLGSALLHAWEAKDASEKAGYSFKGLQATLSDSFRIVLKGEPGETVRFNPRLHELLDRSSDTELVRVLRPRVELTGEPISTVLIKSVVEPAGEKP